MIDMLGLNISERLAIGNIMGKRREKSLAIYPTSHFWSQDAKRIYIHKTILFSLLKILLGV